MDRGKVLPTQAGFNPPQDAEKLGTVLDDLHRNGAGRANQDRFWCQQAISLSLQVQASTLDEIEIQEQGLGAAMTAIVDQWT